MLGHVIGGGRTPPTLYTKFQDNTSIGIAYLYCNFRRQHEQKPADLLVSLLKQLIQQRPSVPENVKSLYHRHMDKRTRPSLEEISKVLHSIVARKPSRRRKRSNEQKQKEYCQLTRGL
jgi:hypothetical protein